MQRLCMLATGIGANALAARVSGVLVERHLILVYTLAGLLAGLGGVVTSARAASGQAPANPAIPETKSRRRIARPQSHTVGSGFH